MKYCKDCEPAQESHFIAYTSVLLGYLDEPFFRLMQAIFKDAADRAFDRLSVPFMKGMAAIGLGRFSEEPDAKDSWRTRSFWEEAKRRGIRMREFHMGPVRDAFIASWRGKTIVFDGLPRPGLSDSPSLRWMDNKGIMKKKFRAEGLPVAPGGTAFTKRGAIKIFSRINKPVITKPNLGSRSRHTMIHLDTPEKLVAGFRKAKKLSPIVIVEEELRGYLFRGTLVGGKLVGVVRRDQPEVTGDGVSTLRTLLDKENERPERQGPLFHKIPLDKEAEEELKRQNITLGDVPEKGRTVVFSQKTSRGVGGTTTSVTSITHPDNKEMLEHVARFLKDDLIGVDFILEDISKSWKEEQHSGIIECNSLPFIDLHHYPLFGRADNVAGAVWDLVWPESHVD